jgi:uncharacterized membrane protein YecN with MAPEG domain
MQQHRFARQVEGEDWYKRATRAHANCIENLPVFGAIVLALHVGGVRGQLVNGLCIGVVVARVLQSLVQRRRRQTNAAVSIRLFHGATGQLPIADRDDSPAGRSK